MSVQPRRPHTRAERSRGTGRHDPPRLLPGYATFARLHRVGTSLPVQWDQPHPGWEPLALTAALPPSATVFLLETPGGAPDLERRSFLAWDPEQEFILRRGMLETRRHGRKPILRRCRTPLTVLQRALATAGVGAVPYTEGFHGGLVGYVGYDFKNCLERLPDRVRDPDNHRRQPGQL